MEGRIDTQLLTDTADAIRFKSNTQRKYSPSEFSGLITRLGGGGIIPDVWDADSIVEIMKNNDIPLGEVLTAYDNTVACYYRYGEEWSPLDGVKPYEHYHLHWHPDYNEFDDDFFMQGIYYFDSGCNWDNCYEAKLGHFIVNDLPNYVESSLMEEMAADIAINFTEPIANPYDFTGVFYENLYLNNVFDYLLEYRNAQTFDAFFNNISVWERDDAGKIANGLSANPDLLNKVLYSLGKDTIYEIAFENLGDAATYIENNIGLDYFLDYFNGNDIAYYLAYHQSPNVVINAYTEAIGIDSFLSSCNSEDLIKYIDEYYSSSFFDYYISNHGYEEMLSYVDNSDLVNYVINNVSADEILSSMDSGTVSDYVFSNMSSDEILEKVDSSDILSYVVNNQSTSDVVQALYDYNGSYDDILNSVDSSEMLSYVTNTQSVSDIIQAIYNNSGSYDDIFSSIGNDAIKEYLESQGYIVEEG